jgi:hypothetical protein
MPSLESSAAPLVNEDSTTATTLIPAAITIPTLEIASDKRPLEDGSSPPSPRKSKRMRLQTPKALESPVSQSHHAPILPPPPLPIRDMILTPTQALSKVFFFIGGDRFRALD